MKYFIIALVIIIVIIVFWFIGTYNGFISLRNKSEEAFSTMDVYLVKRYDLIPNLVETVKGYAKHESETLEGVIKARNSAVSATTHADKIESENQFAGALSRLFALSESYPELKANTNFLDLQKQLQSIENEIANSRKYYNGVVKQFNTKCETIPSNFVANICGFRKLPLFVVTELAQRENVKVQF